MVRQGVSRRRGGRGSSAQLTTTTPTARTTSLWIGKAARRAARGSIVAAVYPLGRPVAQANRRDAAGRAAAWRAASGCGGGAETRCRRVCRPAESPSRDRPPPRAWPGFGQPNFERVEPFTAVVVFIPCQGASTGGRRIVEPLLRLSEGKTHAHAPPLHRRVARRRPARPRGPGPGREGAGPRHDRRRQDRRPVGRPTDPRGRRVGPRQGRQ